MKTSNKTKLLVSSLTAIMLFGCQNIPVKDGPDDELKAETMALGWTQLQQSTLTHLKNKSFGEAELTLKQMMVFAGEDNEKWEYIRMGIISMPPDIANDLIDKAFEKPFIKNSNDQKFAFSRVYTQLKQEEKALSLINTVIKNDKQADYVYWRARLYLLLEKETKAEKDYLWLLQEAPEDKGYISQYASLLSFLKREDEAMQLLMSHEDDVDLLFRQVVLLIQKDNTELAEKKFEKLKQMVDVNDIDAEQKLNIGELAFWLKSYDFSLQLLQSINSGDEVNEAKLMIANIYTAQKNYERAAVMYKQVQNGPEQHAIPAYQLEIELYRKQQEYDQAINVADMSLRMFKNHPELLYSRAMLYGEIDQIEELEKDLSQIIRDDPENPDALNALGYTWADHDMNLDLAYQYITQANALKPNDKAILDSMGWIYYKKGELAKAEGYLRQAVDGYTLDSEPYLHLIEVLKKKGDMDAADIIIKQIKELFPNDDLQL